MNRTGLDALLGETSRLAGRNVGLLAHGASLTYDLVPAHLALARRGVSLAALFGPEHGFYGVEQDMVASADRQDPWTGAPIRSLYGESESSLRPQSSAVEALDLLIVDLQDVGARYYTYAATAVWAAEVALDNGCEVWVLDRPNPLGGVEVEGNLRGEEFESFVGAFSLPARHGLTLGEIFALEMKRKGRRDGFEIWPLEGWTRDQCWWEWGRPWVAPSPNLPTVEAAAVYPGLCLLEATMVSEGRGTTRPFLLFGAPEVDGPALAEALNRRGFSEVFFLPTRFKPQFQKHAGQVCEGVELAIIADPRELRSYALGFAILEELYAQLGGESFWRTEAYEFVTDRSAMDLLAGSAMPREIIESRGDLTSWMESWGADEASFREERREILLYEERS